MCTQIHIVQTMYTSLLQWVDGLGVVYRVCLFIFLIFRTFHIQKGVLSNNRSKIKDQNRVQCNNVKTQYYLQMVVSAIVFKMSEIVGCALLYYYLVILLYPLYYTLYPTIQSSSYIHCTILCILLQKMTKKREA